MYLNIFETLNSAQDTDVHTPTPGYVPVPTPTPGMSYIHCAWLNYQRPDWVPATAQGLYFSEGSLSIVLWEQ